MTNDWIRGLLGGGMIGLASAILLMFNGRIFGVSGIVAGALSRGPEATWRWFAIAGLIGGGFLLRASGLTAFDPAQLRSGATLIAAGLLVGFGTRLGGGCTSGHGVCGISRLSPRSILATVVFVGVGMATATLYRFIAGGAS